MARVAVELTNFTGGELSPRLDGRTDLAKYESGCSTLENLVVYPHGSAAVSYTHLTLPTILLV